jgi:excinuclease ABC subunit C
MRLNSPKIPDRPGVYLLKNSKNKVLYIGKAVSLKKRLKYYTKHTNDSRLNALISKVSKVDIVEVKSEIESLILEANLIKQYKPHFNVSLKDDKDYLYIIITKDKFPKVLPARKRSIKESKAYFGPYPSATAVRRTLKVIRRIFPYSTCNTNKGRACLSHHLGLCPGVCIGSVTKKEYDRTISSITAFLQGRKQKILDQMRKDVRVASSKLKFEEAAEIQKKLESLEYVLQPTQEVKRYTEDPDFIRLYHKEELEDLQEILKIPRFPKRIEGYDISNIHGKHATGSMVVFTEGKAEKSEYRRFKIKKIQGISDTDMMKEVLTRRFGNDWQKPDLIIVDGGKGQLSACLAVLEKVNLSIPCAALAKRMEQLYVPENQKPIRLPANAKSLHLVQRIRDEAHRFAISYHRSLRDKRLLTLQNGSVTLSG